MKKITTSLLSIWALCGVFCSAATARPMDLTGVHSVSAEEVPFFKIPDVRKSLAASDCQLRKDLETLPVPASIRPYEAYGYHGGYLPALDQLPEEPRWTIEFEFDWKIEQIILVPALDYRFENTESYGFPRRFRVLRVRKTGEVDVIKEWMDSDCPDPGGQSSLHIDLDGRRSYIIRLEVFEGATAGDRELFALDEVYGLVGESLSDCSSVTVSSEYESLPYWSKDYLVDKRTSLGLPAGAPCALSPADDCDDFMVVFNSPVTNGCTVELDMGKNSVWNQIALFPAQPPDDIVIPGYGFPKKLSIIIQKENQNGGRGKTYKIPNAWGVLTPGNNVVNISLPRTGHTCRWIRLNFQDLPLHNGRSVFAMGEILVSKYEPVSVSRLQLKGCPEAATPKAGRMIDGMANGRPVLSLRPWLQQLTMRRQLLMQQHTLQDFSTGLKKRWDGGWRSAALLIGSLALAGALLFALFLFIQRRRTLQKMKCHIAHEKHQIELEQLKIRFFTHISHELRTPLTVISGPLEKLVGELKNTPLEEYSLLAHRNVKKLQRLVDQLLDFRKLQEGKEILKWQEVDINAFFKNGFTLYQSMAVDRQIDYQITLPSTSHHLVIDCEKLQKMLDNLISNALKYTPQNGEVKVLLTVEPENEGIAASIHFDVEDTGEGIPAQDLPHIFEQYYRADGLQAVGSGIGLAFVNDLVNLWGGTICVISPVAAGHGTRFSVQLPVGSAGDVETAPEPSELPIEPLVAEPVLSAERDIVPTQRRAKILLVEDDDDVRSYVRLELNGIYELLEAENGKLGLQRALETAPDLVLSDVMMPEMNGIDLCTQLKQDERTSHIPVILLTARGSVEHRIEGLETGADDYVAKPFSMPLLQARIQNLLDSRQRLRERFSREIKVEPGAITVTTTDELLLRRAIEVVEENMGNCEFSVVDFVSKMKMARSTLFVKLQALVDQSPQEFIRTLRLKRAQQLLAQSTDTIAEIAFQVGFLEPTNFSRSFKKQFNLSPSAFREQQNES